MGAVRGPERREDRWVVSLPGSLDFAGNTRGSYDRDLYIVIGTGWVICLKSEGRWGDVQWYGADDTDHPIWPGEWAWEPR